MLLILGTTPQRTEGQPQVNNFPYLLPDNRKKIGIVTAELPWCLQLSEQLLMYQNSIYEPHVGVFGLLQGAMDGIGIKCWEKWRAVLFSFVRPVTTAYGSRFSG